MKAVLFGGTESSGSNYYGLSDFVYIVEVIEFVLVSYNNYTV